MTPEHTRVDGLDWHALAAGDPDAPAVVVVHGLGAASEAQRPIARRLAHHFRVLVPDLPGFGRSASPRARLDVAGLADALAGWMVDRDHFEAVPEEPHSGNVKEPVPYGTDVSGGWPGSRGPVRRKAVALGAAGTAAAVVVLLNARTSEQQRPRTSLGGIARRLRPAG